jgi:hypothetical protein
MPKVRVEGNACPVFICLLCQSADGFIFARRSEFCLGANVHICIANVEPETRLERKIIVTRDVDAVKLSSTHKEITTMSLISRETRNSAARANIQNN